VKERHAERKAKFDNMSDEEQEQLLTGAETEGATLGSPHSLNLRPSSEHESPLHPADDQPQ
jgi:hypothetical protein